MAHQTPTAPLPPPMKRVRLTGVAAAAAVGWGNIVSTGGGDMTPSAATLPGTPAGLFPPTPISPLEGGTFVPLMQPSLSGAIAPPLPAASRNRTSCRTGRASASPRAASATAAGSSPPAEAVQLTPAQKVERILKHFPSSFCQELQINMDSGSPESLWQWLCASILFSARIKSNAGLGACRALQQAGLSSPQDYCQAGLDVVREALAASGFDRYDDKTAGFLLENAQAVMEQYGGDLNQLREAAGRSATQERALLKKLRGVGDGAVDIFFRQVQVAWEELFPFGDKKALKAARLVGLKEHPQALAELCGWDRPKYARLLAALAAVDMTRSYADF